MDILQKTVFLMNEYLRVHEKNPTKVYLTLKEENELALLPGVDVINGPRSTFKETFLGMKVNWNAKEFKVE